MLRAILVGMFIAKVVSKGKNGKSYTSVLLRESVRVGSKVKSVTVAVLTRLPPAALEAVRRSIESPAGSLDQAASQSGGSLRLRCGESFGAIWTVDQLARQLGLDKALGVTRQAQLGYWQVLARVLHPGSSLLSMVRLASSSAAAAILGWRQTFTEDNLYTNGSWLEGRHAVIERRLWVNSRKPANAQLFLYDVTSSYLEGGRNALGDWGYNRDGKKGKKQLVVGLLTDAEGEPRSIQVYRGNTSDLTTFPDQVHKLKTRFGCQGVTLVGDRGMIRQKQMAQAKEARFHYITCLTKPQIEKLLARKVLQMDLFEEKICEVAVQEGGECLRYVLRRNPFRQKETAQSRQEKKAAMEKAVVAANAYLASHPRAKPATQAGKIAARLKGRKVDNWLAVETKGRKLALKASQEELDREAQLDGCYVVQTDLPSKQADAQTVHDRYKDLGRVERDFRTLKQGHLEMRPWFVAKEENTQAHALTCMLALKVRRRLEKAWWPLETTVEEGLRELETLCVTELVHEKTGAVAARQIPLPSPRQKQLLDALGLTLPAAAPEAKVKVVTRKKINKTRKPVEK